MLSGCRGESPVVKTLGKMESTSSTDSIESE